MLHYKGLPPTPEIQEYSALLHSLPSRYERTCDSVFFGAACVKSCETIPLLSERATSPITYARGGGLAIEDPAYDTTNTTAHPPDEIAQAVTSAILLLSNDEHHCRYDKSRLFLPDRQQTKSQPRDSSLSSPVSDKRPEGRDSKAYRHTVSSISLACYTHHYTPQWTECVLESAE